MCSISPATTLDGTISTLDNPPSNLLASSYRHMRSLLATLICFLTLSTSSAQRVVDNAHLFAGRSTELAQHLPPHVWVETHVQPPGGSLESYAEQRAASHAASGQPAFVIAISTSPRNWQIRMAPVGTVSGQATHPIGTELAAGLRAGRAYDAVLTAARRLEGLLSATAPALEPPPTSQIPPPDRTMVPISEEERVQRIAQLNAQREAEARALAQRDRVHAIVGWAVGIGLLLLGSVIWWGVRYKAQLRAQQEAQRARERAEHQRREEERAKEVRERADRTIAAARTNPVQTAAARTAFSCTSEVERQRIAERHSDSPYYTAGCHNDPLLWYLLGSSVGHLNHDGTVYTPPAPEPSSYHRFASQPSYPSSSSSRSRDDDDDRRRSSSSSDSSYSSSSYDSSSSSYDSGSSSSDSGSGGSW